MQDVPVHFGGNDEWWLERMARTSKLELAGGLDRSNELGAIVEHRVGWKQVFPIEEEPKVNDPRQSEQPAVRRAARSKGRIGKPRGIDDPRRLVELGERPSAR